jgi:hypothetical protein
MCVLVTSRNVTGTWRYEAGLSSNRRLRCYFGIRVIAMAGEAFLRNEIQ